MGFQYSTSPGNHCGLKCYTTVSQRWGSQWSKPGPFLHIQELCFRPNQHCYQQRMAGKMWGSGPRASSHLQVWEGVLSRALHFQARWSAVLQLGFYLFSYVLVLIREKIKRLVSNGDFKKRCQPGTFGKLSEPYATTPSEHSYANKLPKNAAAGCQNQQSMFLQRAQVMGIALIL